MIFHWTPWRVVNRYWFTLTANQAWVLEFDIDALDNTTVVINVDGSNTTKTSPLTEEEKKELLETLNGYWFSEVIEEVKMKEKKEKEIDPKKE